MSASKRKKKTRKEKQRTLQKDPSIILSALREVTQKYYNDLSIKREEPKLLGTPMRFKRFKADDER